MNIILIGPPACGKGTQAKLLSEKFNLVHISTGELIREIISNKQNGYQNLLEYVSKGKLVPDELVINLLKEHLETSNTKNGFLFDGFPRTLNQANLLETIISVDYIFEIRVSEQSVNERITERFVCENCGASYSKKLTKNDFCTECSGKLIKRVDDTQEKLANRYKDYWETTNSVLNYYKNRKGFHQINGEKSVEMVFDQICKYLEE
ncbi:MAG: nucleoside monophosphate kinase [Clostridia bacterium]|nr:nucleoside monophosphate kinase [Clostridia bacterium]